MSLVETVTALAGFLESHPVLLRGMILGSATMFLLTPVLAPLIIILMPADALLRYRRKNSLPQQIRSGRLLWHFIKDVLGGVLILLGILLLFMPGQGLLTIFVGLMIADLPGKRRLLGQLLSRDGVRTAVEKIRRRWNRPPLQYPTDPDSD